MRYKKNVLNGAHKKKSMIPNTTVFLSMSNFVYIKSNNIQHTMKMP